MLTTRTNRLTRSVLALIMAATPLISGCASIVNGDHQYIRVDTVDEDSGAELSSNCRITTPAFSKLVRSGEIIRVKRSSEPLTIDCEDGLAAGHKTEKSDFLQIYLFANLATDFCLISCIVDASKGAWYEYPSPLVVKMRQLP